MTSSSQLYIDLNPKDSWKDNIEDDSNQQALELAKQAVEKLDTTEMLNEEPSDLTISIMQRVCKIVEGQTNNFKTLRWGKIKEIVGEGNFKKKLLSLKELQLRL